MLLGCQLPRGCLSLGPHYFLSQPHICACLTPLPPGADMDPNPRAALERQQLRLRERQKFFEDILQPETEFVFPLSHLHLESQRRKFQVLRKNWGRLGKMFLRLSDLRGQLPSCFCGPINSEIVISQLSLIMLSTAAQSVCSTSPYVQPP